MGHCVRYNTAVLRSTPSYIESNKYQRSQPKCLQSQQVTEEVHVPQGADNGQNWMDSTCPPASIQIQPFKNGPGTTNPPVDQNQLTLSVHHL